MFTKFVKSVYSQVGGFCANVLFLGADRAFALAPFYFARDCINRFVLRKNAGEALNTPQDEVKAIAFDFKLNSTLNGLLEISQRILETMNLPVNRALMTTLRTVFAGVLNTHYQKGLHQYDLARLSQDIETGLIKAFVFTQMISMMQQALDDPENPQYGPYILAASGALGECVLYGYQQLRSYRAPITRNVVDTNEIKMTPNQNRNR